MNNQELVTPLFILQLRELSRTMYNAAKAEDFELNMDTWVSRRPDEHLIEKPLCGYAACVCGAQAATGRISLFVTTNCYFELGTMALLIADTMCRACEILTGTNFLAESVYSGSQCRRSEKALDADIFTNDELKSFNHLTSGSPTAKDAADYIDAVIKKLESKYL